MKAYARTGKAPRRCASGKGTSINKLLICALLTVCCTPYALADMRFTCPTQLATLEQQLPRYLRALGIPAEWLTVEVDSASGSLSMALNTLASDTRTLDFFNRPAFALTTEQVLLPTRQGKLRRVATVSRKEIVLALLQHGRLTEFKGDACSLEALSDQVGVRQNIVAWAENLNWRWPNGGSAQWNEQYWRWGTPKAGTPLHVAVMDAFIRQEKYAIGCYTATKLLIVQGMLDYYRRVKEDPVRARRVEDALLVDGEPLVGVEPGNMWSFERDFDPRDIDRRGKLLNLHAEVAADNFVPGDWAYLRNTDAASEQKTGYEGSNAIYMGRNRFDDYYNDHRHGYTYEQKLNEVYQWRNGVFNRIRDAGKARPLAAREQKLLTSTPAEGGIQLDIRVGPRYF